MFKECYPKPYIEKSYPNKLIKYIFLLGEVPKLRCFHIQNIFQNTFEWGQASHHNLKKKKEG